MHPCDRCTATCHVRVSCDTTGRVSLLKEALLSRFYRRTETPVHRPRPIRKRERERRETAMSEADQRPRTKDRKQNWTLPSSSIFPPKGKEEQIFVARNRESSAQQMPAREMRAEKGSGFPISASFFPFFFLPWHKRLRLGTEEREKKEMH